MPVSKPSITAAAAHRTITLDELRELVAAAESLPGDTIVRGAAIPFHMPDLGNPLGGRMQRLALDTHQDER